MILTYKASSSESHRKDVVTVVKADKGVHEIAGPSSACSGRICRAFPVLQDEVDFVKADDGPFRQVDRGPSSSKWWTDEVEGFISSW